MISSLAFILLFGFFFKVLFEKMRLPGLLGMLLFGIIISPHSANLIHESILNISSDLRNIALIIILLRAGLGINRTSLEKLGTATVKMSFIPGILEGLTIALISTKLLDFSFIEGGILGFIIAAVSPAVIVPSMLNLMDRRLGIDKNIPTLIMSSTSIDDVVAITIFGAFINMYFNEGANISLQLLSIPSSIIIGLLSGFLIGYILILFFRHFNTSNIAKILIVLSTSMIFSEVESVFNLPVKIATLLGIMGIGFFIRENEYEIADELSLALNNAWFFAQILLFTLIGAEVNIFIALKSSFIGIIIIIFGLIARSIGVLISIKDLDFNNKEKLFCVISYIPKATVQAAIGAVPLALGVESGYTILTIAVLSIIITAPIGSILIDYYSNILLEKG